MNKTLTSFKKYAYNTIPSNPSRYGIDGGELHLINDYLRDNTVKAIILNDGLMKLSSEHLKVIVNLIRRRAEFLQDEANRAYNMREKNIGFIHIGQTSIYDFLEDETAQQLPKIIKYWESDANRYSYSNSTIKKSIRGIDDEHIIAARVMLPLLIANPKLKQKRVKKSKVGNNVLNSAIVTKTTGAEDALRNIS